MRTTADLGDRGGARVRGRRAPARHADPDPDTASRSNRSRSSWGCRWCTSPGRSSRRATRAGSSWGSSSRPSGWFVIVYPNIAALPLPSTVVNAYQGLLPTYLYAFQFPVSEAQRNVPTPFVSPTLVILTLAIGATCLVVAYSASVWRLALAESKAAEAGSGSGTGASPGDGADSLARTGGGA